MCLLFIGTKNTRKLHLNKMFPDFCIRASSRMRKSIQSTMPWTPWAAMWLMNGELGPFEQLQESMHLLVLVI